MLHVFFSKCFNSCLIPSGWRRAVISPILKCSDKDPYVPLNSRGIGLRSCMYKTYSSKSNNRLAHNLEIVFDEQNNFHSSRSCTEHIFSFTSLIRNRLASGNSSLPAFIDLQKAFDWVDRDLLFYKLPFSNINGKIYKAVQ